MIDHESPDRRGARPGPGARSPVSAPRPIRPETAPIAHGHGLLPGDRVLVGRNAYQTSMLDIHDPCADVHPVVGAVDSVRDHPDGSLEVAVRLDCDGRIHRFDASDLLPFE